MQTAKIIGIAIFALVVLALAIMIIAKSKKSKKLYIPEDYSKYNVLYEGRGGQLYKVYFAHPTNGPRKGEWTTYCWRTNADGISYKSYFKYDQTVKFIHQLIEELNKNDNIYSL